MKRRKPAAHGVRARRKRGRERHEAVGTSKLRPMRWDLILQWHVQSGMAPSPELMAAATKAREAWA